MGPPKKEKRETTMMTIGEYAGNEIDTIPNYYLKWVAENWDEDSLFKKRLVKACDDELQWRIKNGIEITKEDFLADKVSK